MISSISRTISRTMSYGTFASASSTFTCPGRRPEADHDAHLCSRYYSTGAVPNDPRSWAVWRDDGTC
ncbi:hypothetical protein OG689_34430 [Kitasatospora sp. NBC_00240]|uniref:hypothetical protein n=1 Tax=Kitasatospora sp. NBC_00240 TaxID=2903567 RepID=UPI002259EB29|nr:hypothetical protein [Kitasatospora sp. NBC_00240]MCX5214303.1 hypothetical protein [Kitasatospora sp. NBC_00240]